MSNNSSGGGGVSLGTVIFLILLFLKLFGVINISWGWVFAPLLISIAFWVAMLIFIFIFTKKS